MTHIDVHIQLAFVWCNDSRYERFSIVTVSVITALWLQAQLNTIKWGSCKSVSRQIYYKCVLCNVCLIWYKFGPRKSIQWQRHARNTSGNILLARNGVLWPRIFIELAVTDSESEQTTGDRNRVLMEYIKKPCVCFNTCASFYPFISDLCGTFTKFPYGCSTGTVVIEWSPQEHWHHPGG